MEYILNEYNKNGENFKRKVLSSTSKIHQNPQKPSETKNEKIKENFPKKEEKSEEKQSTAPSNNESFGPSSSNILNKIMNSIDEDHELDDQDIDSYINVGH